MGFVHVTDLDAAREFYVERLGLELVEESPFALVVRTGPILLRLTPVEEHAPASGTVFGWVVDDIDSSMHALDAAGIPPKHFDGIDHDENGVWQSPTAARIGWFADPDGNTLSITQF